MFEHPGADRMRQSKPAVFYGGSGPPTPALVGLVRALLQEGTTLERGAQEQDQQTPQSTQGVTAGLGQGADPGWNLLLDFPWSAAVNKANLASVIRDNGRRQKKNQAQHRD